MTKSFLHIVVAFAFMAISWQSTMYCDSVDVCRGLLTLFDYHLITYSGLAYFCVAMLFFGRALYRAAQ